MFIHFKRLTKQILYYGLGDTINRLIAVLILPLFTRFLSPADYGVASVLTVTNALIVSFSDFGLMQSIIRFYREEKPDKQRQLITNAQLIMVLSTLAIALIAIHFGKQISQFFFKTPDYSYIIALNFFTIPLAKLITAPMVKFRVQEKANAYAFLSVAQVVSTITLNALLIIGLKHGVRGLFEGPFISSAIFALGIGIYSFKTNGFNISLPLLKKMLVFGCPLILNSVAMWIINWADRFILAKITTLSEVGLYTLGYSIGMAVTLPVNAFITAWAPFYMSVSKNPDHKEIYSTVFTYYSAAIGFFVLIVAVLGRDYFYFFTKSEFHGAALVVPIIALAYAFRGNFSITAAGAYLKHKTYLVTATELIAMVLNISLVFILAPHYGRLGAAWATLISYLVLPIGMYLITLKIFPIKYDLKRLFQIIFIGGLVYWLCQWVYAPTVLNLILRLAIIMLYPFLFILLGFFKPEEKARIKALLIKVFKRKMEPGAEKVGI